MKKLYEFYHGCGRMGELEGLFIAEERDIEKIIGKEIYFGEVLGKHSEIIIDIDKIDIVVKTDDQEFIAFAEKYIGKGTLSGHNPLDYYEE